MTHERIEGLRTALRRIRSLDEKNVPKYAQEIARTALDKDAEKERKEKADDFATQPVCSFCGKRHFFNGLCPGDYLETDHA